MKMHLKYNLTFYSIQFIIKSFTVNDLELFHTFLFDQCLELYDLDRKLNIPKDKGDPNDFCHFYHCLPRFARKLQGKNKFNIKMNNQIKFR